MKKMLALVALCALALPSYGQQFGEIKRFTLTGPVPVPQFRYNAPLRTRVTIVTPSLFCLRGITCLAVSKSLHERPNFLAADPFSFTQPSAPHPVLSFFKGRLELGGKSKNYFSTPPVRMFRPFHKGPRGAISLRYVF